MQSWIASFWSLWFPRSAWGPKLATLCVTAGHFAAVGLLTVAARGAELPAPTIPPSIPPTAVLHLANGDSLPGRLQASDQPSRLRWRCGAFTAPFDFALDAVSAIYFPPPSNLPKPVGHYCFELAGGDVLFGSLMALGPDEAELDVSPFGRLHVQRAVLHRLYRWREGTELVYLGPKSLTDWQESSPKKGWREESGHLVSTQEATALFADVGLPTRACIELECSWTKKPDFVVALGVSADSKTDSSAFRFEVWDRDVVIQRETELEADVASVQEIASADVGVQAAGRLHVQMYLDQERGRALVVAANGKPVTDLTVASQATPVWPGIRLTNRRGDLRLERLRIGRWNGQPPREVRADKSRIHRTDGSIVYGQVKAFDAAAQQFVVSAEDGESRMATDEIQSVCLSQPSYDGLRTLRVALHDGTRVSGTPTKMAGESVSLTCPGVREPMELRASDLNALVLLRHEQRESPPKGRRGRLDLEGIQLHGCLVDGREQADASCLVWQPNGSFTASPLQLGASGCIAYREPTPPRNPQTPRQPEPAQPVGLAWLAQGLSRMRTGGPLLPTIGSEPQRFLHLRNGDTIPCEATRINEHGVMLRTPLSDATFIAHDKVKALELADEQQRPKLGKVIRERLLTLPRMQKGNPPTQLIQATTGDYLRGRIVSMDDRTLAVEVRLDTQELPRDRIARIIWLYDDALATAPKPAAAVASSPTRVQAVRSDGTQLTFVAKQLTDMTLSGQNDVLGVCRVDLTQIDKLVFGVAIDHSQSVDRRWNLHNAIEPKSAIDEESSRQREQPGSPR